MEKYGNMLSGYQCKGQGVKNALFACIFMIREKVMMDN